MATLDQTTYRLTDLTSYSAQLPVASKVAISIAHKVLIWKQLSRTRKTLSSLSETELQDIGLSRYQARIEADKRFWQR